MAGEKPLVRFTVEFAGWGTPREVATHACGLGSLALIALAMTFGTSTGLDGGRASLAALAFGLASALVLIAASVADARVHRLFRRLNMGIACAAVCAAASLALCATGGLPGVAGDIAAGACGAAVGGAAAVLALYWGISFGRCESPAIVMGAVGGFALSLLVYTLVVEELPAPWGHAVASLAPIFSAWCLRNRVTERLDDPEMREALYFNELQIKRLKFALKNLPSMFCMGISLGLLLAYGGHIMLAASDGGGAAWAVLAIGAAALFVLAGFVMLFKTAAHSLDHMFRLCIPVLALMALPLGAAQAGHPDFSVCLLFVYAAGHMLVWAFLANTSQEFRLSPLFVFGLGVGGVALGTALAGALAEACGNMPVFASTAPEQRALVLCLLSLTVTCGLFPRREDIRAIVTKTYDPRQMFRAGNTDGADATDAGGTAGAPDGQRGSTGEAAGTRGGKGVRAETGERPGKGRFIRRCECVADIYLLSRRETEVLVLLAKGHNASYIRENLCISEGTVKTHVHHIYKKLGVHSQQELIELIDGVQVS